MLKNLLKIGEGYRTGTISIVITAIVILGRHFGFIPVNVCDLLIPLLTALGLYTSAVHKA